MSEIESSVLTNIRYGQLITTIDEDIGESETWLIFQTAKGSNRCYTGLFCLKSWKSFRYGWFWGSIRYDMLIENALEIQNNDRTNILVAEYDDSDYIWLQPLEENENEWIPWGKLEFGTPKDDRTYPLLWAKIWSNPAQSSIKMSNIPLSEKIDSQINKTLESIGNLDLEIVHTKIDLKTEKERYLLEFHRPDDSEILYEKREPNTKEIREFLRYPRTTGLWYETEDGLKLTWDPFADVIYAEGDDPEPIEVIRPYINRSTLPPGLDFPDNAAEFESAEVREGLLLLFKRERRNWKLWLLGPDIGTRLLSLENDSYSNSQVVLLAESKYLFDRHSNSLYKIKVALDFDKKKMSIPKIFLSSPLLCSALAAKGIMVKGIRREYPDDEQDELEKE
ncbi:MAG: hypothetical protein GF411_10705 [Candidatus Lokiarchaeota archaeon]|nr:hypothetical protein [Candidatus Lokiarchaeota archaeon]